MKTSATQNFVRGFTTPEVLTAMAIFSMLIAATVSSQMFGLRMYKISEAKLISTDSARDAVGHVRNEIRSSAKLYIGMGDDSTFTQYTNNAPRVGNALRICPTSDTNNFICYYLNTNCLMRRVSGSTNVQLISRNITNQMVFQAEDFTGQVLTNDDNNRIIGVTLQYYKLEYMAAAGGSGGIYDTYRLQTRIARRAR